MPGAAQFTRTNSEYLSRASNSALQVGNIDFWFALRVYPDSVGGSHGLITKDNSEYRMYLATDNSPIFFAGSDFASVGVISTSTWTFLLGYYDSGTQRVYLSKDGAAFSSTAVVTPPIASGTEFHIGEYVANYMDGRLDSIAYGKSPSGGIAGIINAIRDSLYNSGNGKAYSDLMAQEKTDWGLVSFWNLDELSGTRNDDYGTNHLTDNNTVTSADGIIDGGDVSSSSSSPSSSTLSSSSSSTSSLSSSSSSTSSLSSSSTSSASSSSSSSASSSSSSSTSSGIGSITARGSWLIDEAVKKRWDSRSLEAQFRAVWADPARLDCIALDDSEARAAGPHPMPYCIYEKGEPRVVGNMSGRTRDTEEQIQDIPIQFTVYGRDKTQAKDFAKLVAGAFDKARLEVQDDHLVTIIRGSDFDVRQDDETWSWTIQYTVRIIGTYNSALS